jgi:hypothetical protein
MPVGVLRGENRGDLVIPKTMAGAALLALATTLVLPPSASAQAIQGTRTTTIQIEYHEPVPVDGDRGAVRTKIYAQVQKDCEEAAKAFQMRCTVNSLSFSDPRNAGMQTPFVAIAHAQLTLFGEAKPAGGSN